MSSLQPLLDEAERSLPALRASFLDATRDADHFATRFYDRLFALAPSVRSLFPSELKPQQKKLMQALTLLVSSLERSNEIAPALRQLGLRHAGYGVQIKHYAMVGQALVETLSDCASTPMEESLRLQWATLYGWVAATMIEGQSQARSPAATVMG